jgi:hypothetical protein
MLDSPNQEKSSNGIPENNQRAVEFKIKEMGSVTYLERVVSRLDDWT